MVESAFIVGMVALVVLSTAAGFGYSGTAGWLAATAKPGVRKFGLRSLAATLVATGAAGFLVWAVLSLKPEISVDPSAAMLPVVLALLGYPAGYVGGLLHRAGRLFRSG